MTSAPTPQDATQANAAPSPALVGPMPSEQAKHALHLSLIGAVLPFVYTFIMVCPGPAHIVGMGFARTTTVAALLIGMALEGTAFKQAWRTRTYSSARVTLGIAAFFFAVWSLLAYLGAQALFAWQNAPDQ